MKRGASRVWLTAVVLAVVLVAGFSLLASAVAALIKILGLALLALILVILLLRVFRS